MARFDMPEKGVSLSELALKELQELIPDWADEALCIGNWELFDLDTGSGRPGRAFHEKVAKAVGVCNTCPVQEVCLSSALEIERQVGVITGVYTIRGGLTPQERYEILVSQV
jgi:hypothetical protein